MKFKLAFVWLLIGLITHAAFAADATNKIKVLLITGGHAFETNQFYKVFEDAPDIILTTAENTRSNAPAYERGDLLSYDAVVLYDMPNAITEAQKAGFLSLFGHGVGLVVLHHALVSYQHWPEYERIIGGHYPESDGKSGTVTTEVGFKHGVEEQIVILAKNHPITTGMDDFTILDEIYWGFRVGADVTPLITTTQPKSGKPLGWYRTEGKSRVVYLQLGHDHTAYDNPNYRQLVACSIRWVSRK